MDKPTIIVEVSGGVVQYVGADAEVNARVVIIDYDNPSVDPHDPPGVNSRYVGESLDKAQDGPGGGGCQAALGRVKLATVPAIAQDCRPAGLVGSGPGRRSGDIDIRAITAGARVSAPFPGSRSRRGAGGRTESAWIHAVARSAERHRPTARLHVHRDVTASASLRRCRVPRLGTYQRRLPARWGGVPVYPARGRPLHAASRSAVPKRVRRATRGHQPHAAHVASAP